MSQDTKDRIVSQTKAIFARGESFSMRTLANKVGITQSVLYHYFKDQEELLKYVFDVTNTQLGQKRAKLRQLQNANEMLRDRITFQLDNAEEIVFVLKYFLTKRKSFPKLTTGYVPDKAYLHIEEVLKIGVENEEFQIDNIQKDAKVITHAINGFLLEYYPARLKGQEKEDLVDSIHNFILRAIVKGGEN